MGKIYYAIQEQVTKTIALLDATGTTDPEIKTSSVN